ncbi:uncharacterized protein GGS22DRAFT_152022 [Annulohypoxylon maeteangense]|uniref:uncharacterized protein n=1 Tax=Annulohypoxylon maeteangense TaxID=1927788 RepID=UPI0020081CBD|nr:uncharacterized protein GGS22DRAFT_152022 [Annulohypoxylon maeteangense]KAI0888634.1 hypothetical protein GGS22DRAFT_152022 [Annulohypoxylon maeteangense]
MSSPEDEELITKISNLASRINRFKAQRDGQPQSESYRPSRTSVYRASPYPSPSTYRGGRGGRGGFRPTYRNKTLVLNGQNQPASDSGEGTNDTSDPPTPTTSFVTRNDRHLQLIKTDVYKKESQNRVDAMKQTLRQKLHQRDQMEKAAFMSSVVQSGAGVAPIDGPSTPQSASPFEVVVDGIRFRVIQQGSKLVKDRDDVNPPSATPKMTTIGGVKFYRTKNGNLIRHGVVKAQRFAGGIMKVNELCKTFAWTGSCPKGPSCRYVHDASKTAICRDYLVKGKCLQGSHCDLSHDITEQRTPLCVHFAKGNCHNASCSYVHAEHSSADPVCRSFGTYGYCEQGAQCPDRHVFECPEFSNTGTCKNKGCKRPHIERASVLRKKNNQLSSGDLEDLSSDDEDAAADSDDIDSVVVEEFIKKEDDDDLDFAQQKDYIGF